MRIVLLISRVFGTSRWQRILDAVQSQRPFFVNHTALVLACVLGGIFSTVLIAMFNLSMAYAWALPVWLALFIGFVWLMRKKSPTRSRTWITAAPMPWQQREGWGIAVAIVLYYIIPFSVQSLISSSLAHESKSAGIILILHFLGFVGYTIFSYRLIEIYCNVRTRYRPRAIQSRPPRPITGTIPTLGAAPYDPDPYDVDKDA